jgi:hypothetical protein
MMKKKVWLTVDETVENAFHISKLIDLVLIVVVVVGGEDLLPEFFLAFVDVRVELVTVLSN